MKTIGIFANCQKPSALEVLHKVTALAKQHGLKLAACDETARLVSGAKSVTPADFVDHIDILMAFGGDGTMLNAVRLLNGRDIPVLGVNMGRLGFLADYLEERNIKPMAINPPKRTSRRQGKGWSVSSAATKGLIAA